MNLSVSQINIILDGLFNSLYVCLQYLKNPENFGGSDLEKQKDEAIDIIHMIYQFALMRERKMSANES